MFNNVQEFLRCSSCCSMNFGKIPVTSTHRGRPSVRCRWTGWKSSRPECPWVACLNCTAWHAVCMRFGVVTCDSLVPRHTRNGSVKLCYSCVSLVLTICLTHLSFIYRCHVATGEQNISDCKWMRKCTERNGHFCSSISSELEFPLTWGIWVCPHLGSRAITRGISPRQKRDSQVLSLHLQTKNCGKLRCSCLNSPRCMYIKRATQYSASPRFW